MRARTSALITDIEIEKLFGRYDYNLKMPYTETNSIPKIGMIYGDNGTGKTTILQLLFHLLSPARGRGHRTFLTTIPLSRFSVGFSNRIKVSVVRKKPNLTGSYTITLKRPNQSLLSAKVEVDEVGGGIKRLSSEAERIIHQIAHLELSIFFLRDDRMLQSDEFPEESPEELRIRERYERTRYRERVRPFDRAPLDRRDAALRQSLDRMTEWLLSRLVRSSTKGDFEAQQIYANIVERINKIGVL